MTSPELFGDAPAEPESSPSWVSMWGQECDASGLPWLPTTPVLSLCWQRVTLQGLGAKANGGCHFGLGWGEAT